MPETAVLISGTIGKIDFSLQPPGSCLEARDLLLVARTSGYRLHHAVEVEAAGLLTRRELAKALEPLADKARRRRDGKPGQKAQSRPRR